MKPRSTHKKLHLENVDIRELLDSENIYYATSGKNVSAGWIGVTCPFPDCGDSTNHCGINIRSKTMSCWKCGRTGTVLTYLSAELNSFNKALEVIKRFTPRELIHLEQDIERSGVSKVELPKNCKPGLSEHHKIYLRKRGFDPDLLADKYNLNHVGPVGDFANRIIIPVMKNYRLVTFTSMDIADETLMRYKHLGDELSIIPIKHLLYNAETSDKHNIGVVEGLCDCWRMGDGFVPTWGVKFTSEQKRLLAKYPNIKIIGDGDKDGWKFNLDLGNELAAFSTLKYYRLEAGIDPDKLTEEEIKYIRNI